MGDQCSKLGTRSTWHDWKSQAPLLAAGRETNSPKCVIRAPKIPEAGAPETVEMKIIQNVIQFCYYTGLPLSGSEVSTSRLKNIRKSSSGNLLKRKEPQLHGRREHWKLENSSKMEKALLRRKFKMDSAERSEV